MSVVDNELRVHGIDGLRVIDASVMGRRSTSTNTNAPTIMIAEKSAAMIEGRSAAENGGVGRSSEEPAVKSRPSRKGGTSA